ncbi:hypothetical protein [Cohnella phaseoli]|uniref:Uncharacterized protein n=1 Tax=Cohnella phaseoli TaxID=456490 RepID=A0A3D9K9T4_9BACL|nr:hypothetical protein [Cohnella phaseoli]RED83281.1 hypothetical protein DFP98_108124 [Cohnella phaseoli]
MRKIRVIVKDLSHEATANPLFSENIMDRYTKAKVVDMRNNHILERTKSGYVSIKPIDPNKIY